MAGSPAALACCVRGGVDLLAPRVPGGGGRRHRWTGDCGPGPQSDVARRTRSSFLHVHGPCRDERTGPVAGTARTRILDLLHVRTLLHVYERDPVLSGRPRPLCLVRPGVDGHARVARHRTLGHPERDAPRGAGRRAWGIGLCTARLEARHRGAAACDRGPSENGGPLFDRTADGWALRALAELGAAGTSTTAADALALLWDDVVGLRG